MIPGGKLLGMALVSTQKALSLVQEQVAGHFGILGALRPTANPNTQKRSTQTDSRQSCHRSVLTIIATFSSPVRVSQSGKTDMAGEKDEVLLSRRRSKIQKSQSQSESVTDRARLVFPGCVYECAVAFFSLWSAVLSLFLSAVQLSDCRSVCQPDQRRWIIHSHMD